MQVKETEKICKNCNKPKELNKENWKANNNSNDGFNHTCRSCKKQKRMAEAYTLVKIKELASDLAGEQEKNEALMLKCDIAEKKNVELQRRNEMLTQDLKDSGKWIEKQNKHPLTTRGMF